MSQEALADKIGVTFQQVQKYEKGTNRVGASRLNMIAEVLGSPISVFFEGVSGNTSRDNNSPGALIAEPQALRLAQAFASIDDANVRRAVADFVEILAADRSKSGGPRRTD